LTNLYKPKPNNHSKLAKNELILMCFCLKIDRSLAFQGTRISTKSNHMIIDIYAASNEIIGLDLIP